MRRKETETQVEFLQRYDADPDNRAKYASYKARKTAGKAEWEAQMHQAVAEDEAADADAEDEPIDLTGDESSMPVLI